MLSLIGPVLSLFTSFFKGEGASKVAGSSNGLMFYGAIVWGIYWLFNDGKNWHITLDALELTGVCLLASIALEFFRKMTPPTPPQV